MMIIVFAKVDYLFRKKNVLVGWLSKAEGARVVPDGHRGDEERGLDPEIPFHLSRGSKGLHQRQTSGL